MSTQSTKVIHLPKVVQDWRKARRRNSGIAVDVNDLRPSAHYVTWTQVSPIRTSANGITRKVELKYAAHQKEIYTEIGLVQRVRTSHSVTLGGVVVTGLAQPITLSLAGLPDEVREMFGDEISIESKVTSEDTSEHVATELNSEPPMNTQARCRVAEVTTTESTCKYYFECQIELKNSDYNPYGENIAVIVNDMKNDTKGAELELDMLYVSSGNGGAVSWIMKGECEFRWSSQPKVKWIH